MTPPAAIPAATLIVFREASGAPELLMVERARAMVFAAGAFVFPGGRIDPGDYAAADGLGDDAAARIAAIRETIEETGVPIGLDPLPDAATVAELRAGLAAGRPFTDLLAAAGLSLQIDALVPFARWLPPHEESLKRVFDTHFYLAQLPAGAPEAAVDDTENVRLVWKSARDMLAAADAGAARIIFPTRRNLERLAQFDSFAAAAAHARDTPIRTVTPWQEERNGMPHLCIPEGLGYPVTAQPLRDTLRG